MSERLSDYDYELPENRIAQEPLADRSAARLMVVDRSTGAWEHRVFRDLPELLEPGDLLVRNATRVTAMRLFGAKPSGGAVEALLLRQDTAPGSFVALVKPGRRLPTGALIEFEGGLRATVGEVRADGQRVLHFEAVEGQLDQQLRECAQAPLPPYIRTRLKDPERYQTVYAKHGGSAAAPTAGLHFTPEVLEALDRRGVETAEVTLSVGLDTFRPVTEDRAADHVMHGEWCSVSEATRDAVARCRGRIIAVGTTSARTLESFAVGPRQLETGTKETRIFITSGYRWRIVDGMITNYHMPRTTMLLMVASLTGRDALMAAYAEALQQNYRFLSFGDAMLIHPGRKV